jgi:hypothetical protein
MTLIAGLNEQIDDLEKEIGIVFRATRTPRSCAVFPDLA